MQPYDYSIQVQQPFQSVLQGYQAGTAIRDDQAKQAAAEAARQAQLQMQADLSALSSNRNATGADYAAMMTRYPQLSEQLKRASETMSGAQQQSFVQQNSPILAALQSNRPDVAERIVRDRAAAMRNSGMEEQAKQDEVLADMIKLNPDIARSSVAFRISALPGGDKVVDSITKLGAEGRAAEKAPAELRSAEAGATKAEADAKTAGVTAKFAERNALADLETKGWNLEGIKADIDYKKQSTRIAAMNAAIAREGNDLKRRELGLKVQEAQQKLDDAARTKVAEVESAAFNMDNMLNTIERVKKNPALNSVVGALEGGDYYPQTLTGMLPGTSSADDRADAIALIETLGSQAFLSQIPNVKGMGQLSNTEGEKLQAALQNLKRKQSETQFRASLDEAARLVTKARENVQKRYGVQLTKPDTPAAPGSRPPLESFNKP
jgi:hypothetical protein